MLWTYGYVDQKESPSKAESWIFCLQLGTQWIKISKGQPFFTDGVYKIWSHISLPFSNSIPTNGIPSHLGSGKTPEMKSWRTCKIKHDLTCVPYILHPTTLPVFLCTIQPGLLHVPAISFLPWPFTPHMFTYSTPLYQSGLSSANSSSNKPFPTVSLEFASLQPNHALRKHPGFFLDDCHSWKLSCC